MAELKSEGSVASKGDSSFGESLATKFKQIGEIQLPLPNPLSSYASYDYILGIGILTDKDLANPDTTYLANKKIPLICKSASIDPDNRIKTVYGKHEFFIDNLVVDGNIGHEQGNNTNTTGITFEVTEPYSMGIFTIACQQAAWDAGHDNWREAPFLLTIEFRGNTEVGTMINVQQTSRYIPFKWQEITMTVKETGAIYQCSVFPYNQSALSSKHATLTTDVSVRGSTVQEVLQTGEKSLQAVWNTKLKQLQDTGVVAIPDQIIILFPEDTSSLANGGNPGDSESTDSAMTVNAIYEKVGVTVDDHKNPVQAPTQCNILGKSSMGYGPEKKPDEPFGKDGEVYDEKAKVFIQSNNKPKANEGDLRFRQDTDIPNAINQVLLQSNFPHDSFKSENTSEEGFKKWWHIDVQVYNVTTDANYVSTGRKPKIVVYRVVPYNVHGSSGTLAPNTKAPGFTELDKKIVKEYNYIYTGKNTDIRNFEISIVNSFHTVMAADGGKQSQDVKEATANGNAAQEKSANTMILSGNKPEKTPGVTPTEVSHSSTGSKTDKLGGGGTETAATRAAKLFHDAVTSGNDMINLEMTIMGDPFYIAQSGTGNYTSVQTEYPDLNADGTVNYQSGETFIRVKFRTPIDINQATGMYDFSGQVATSPVMQYSGIYRIIQVVSTFQKGEFTQKITGLRQKQQEASQTADKSSGFSLDNLISEPINMVKNFGSKLIGN